MKAGRCVWTVAFEPIWLADVLSCGARAQTVVSRGASGSASAATAYSTTRDSAARLPLARVTSHGVWTRPLQLPPGRSRCCLACIMPRHIVAWES